uniref:Uncharacterized protein n=1 Tax=Triticum urartu TaxID=4572 RepID=A0A8R7JWX8_TRIUA
MVLQDIYSLQNRCYVTSLVALLTGISSTTTSQKMLRRGARRLLLLLLAPLFGNVLLRCPEMTPLVCVSCIGDAEHKAVNLLPFALDCVWLWRQLAISTTLTLKLSSLRRMGCRCVELVCDVIKHSRNPNVIVSRNGRELLECPMCLVPMYPPVHQE